MQQGQRMRCRGVVVRCDLEGTDTLETLIPARDGFHADLLIDTVAPDLVVDAAALVDTRQAPMVFELAALLRAIQESYRGGDWDTAADQWQRWQRLAEEYGPQFR